MKLFCAALFLLACHSLHAEGDKISKLARQIPPTKAFLDRLADDDVPEKWRTTFKRENTPTSQKIIYYRGTKRVLTVTWLSDWTGKKDKMFSATIFDGDLKISNIAHIGKNTVVLPVKEGSGYEQIVSLQDTGKMHVLVTHEKGYFESVVVDGRKTHLIDDLEYTKTAIALREVIAPLVEAIKEARKKSGISSGKK